MKTKYCTQSKILQLILLSILNFNIFSQEIFFSDVSSSMGIEFEYGGEFMGGGVSFCDIDGDGLQDISLASGAGELAYIYKNNGDSFRNISAGSGLIDQFESKSLLWADYDNDGDRDLFITNLFASNKLYRNDTAANSLDWRFVDVTAEAGISSEPRPSVAAAWADYNNDGWLDLYVATYNDAMGQDPRSPNWFYENQGDGTFIDVAPALGLADSLKQPWAVVFFDYNNDGWQDLYIGNDKDKGNMLFRNNSDGSFTDVSAASNSDLQMCSMGIAAGDYDNNGYLDLYISNSPAGNALLHNNGDGTFDEIAALRNITVNRICWGANFFDYDNDRDLDIYVSTAEGSPDNYNMLFINTGSTFFPAVGVGLDNNSAMSFGNAIGDFNNDGYPDIAVANNTPFNLWENSGGSNNWIKIELEGTVSNRDGIGAMIEVFCNGDRFIRSTHCGISFISQNSFIQTIGLGTAAVVDSLLIRWPSGIVDVFEGIPANQKIEIVEGQPLSQIKTVSRFFKEGWHLVSLPNNPANKFYKDLFPNAAENMVFGFDNGYFLADSFEICRGYWLFLESSQVVDITGFEIANCSIDVKEGWNLIGGISQNIAFSDIYDPQGLLIPGTLIGFDTQYFFTDTIAVGQGYWINAKGDGQIFLNANGIASGRGTTSGSSSLLSSSNKKAVLSTATFRLPPGLPLELTEIRLKDNWRRNEQQKANVPGEFALEQNYPNPFNPATEIQYSLPQQNKVEVTVYNNLGQVVETLVSKVQEAGIYTVTWNGKNQLGQPVGSGIYFYRVQAGEFRSVKKMLLLR